MEKKKLTINAIAKLAGVAKSTVSRYLNGGCVSQSTALRIKQVIEENDYEPNLFARLNAKRSRIIGLVVPGFNSVITPRLVEVIVKCLKQEQYTPLILDTGNDLLEEKRCVERLYKMNVDGIIVLSTGISQKICELANQINIPLLFLGQNIDNVASIKIDDYHAGYDIGNYVASQGVEKVLCLWVSEHDPAVGVERKKGVVDGLNAAGVSDISFQYTTFFYEDAIRDLSLVLDKKNLPQAIICATDRLASAVYKVCLDNKLKIGQDVFVTGFGDYETSELLLPSLTTIRFDWKKWGEVSVECMLKMIDEEQVINDLVLIPCHLMVRDSCKFCK